MPKAGWVQKALVLGLILVAAQGCVSVGKYNDLQDNYRRLQMQLNDANSKLAALESELDKKDAVAQSMAKDIEELRKLKGSMGLPGEVEMGPGGELIMAADVLFDSGRATLKTKGKEVLGKVAAFIKESGRYVRVDGHTDTDPIKHSGWESNHHLSAARALAVFKEFVKDGIAEGKVHVVGWGPNKPRASNATKEGKAKNRRVEILLYSPDALPKIVPKEERLDEEPLTPPAAAPKVEPHPKT